MATPVLALTELVSAQALPEVVVNETNRWLEFFAGGAKILDRNLATPPGSPADGDTYLVATSGTGAWAGQDGKIAQYISTAWAFKTAKEGMLLYVADEDIRISYNGSAWSDVGAPPSEASAVEIRVGTETGKYLSPDKIYDASVAAALTSGGTITPNGNDGYNFTLTLATNATLANPTNFKEGQSGLIKITQDGTGSRTLAYGSNWKFPSGAPVLSTAAGAIDLLAYHVWSGGEILATLSKGYSV